MLSSGTKCYHLGWNVIIWDAMLSSGANVIIWEKMYHLGWYVITWSQCYHLGLNVIIWDEMLSSWMQCYHLELMLSSGTKGLYYDTELMLSFGANVIIWCYHVMLSSRMITPPFYFSWKLHSLIWGREIPYSYAQSNFIKGGVFMSLGKNKFLFVKLLKPFVGVKSGFEKISLFYVL